MTVDGGGRGSEDDIWVRAAVESGLRAHMATYEPGDYVKVEFPDEATGIGEWMWVRVEVCDDKRKLVYGRLDNEPAQRFRRQDRARVAVGRQLRKSVNTGSRVSSPSSRDRHLN
jgi:hypothetical protein